MATAHDKLLESREGRTALCVEQTITNVTELLCSHLDESGMTRGELARAMGVTPGRVTQLLDGNANLTLASIARALAVFDRVLEVHSSLINKKQTAWIELQRRGDWSQGLPLPTRQADCSEHVPPAARPYSVAA